MPSSYGNIGKVVKPSKRCGTLFASFSQLLTMTPEQQAVRELRKLEREIERQKAGHYCHFTSNNIASLNERIFKLKRESLGLPMTFRKKWRLC